MKKVLKTILAVALCLAMLFCTGCKTGDGAKSGGQQGGAVLRVGIINKGYGTAWLEALLDEFCEQNGVGYKIYPFYDDAVVGEKIEAGKTACDYDLVFAGMSSIAEPKYLAELSDVLNSTIESGSRQGKTIAECIDAVVYSGLNDTKDASKYYMMPWTGGINGLLYNQEAIADKLGDNWQEQYPCRTTDELLDFCKAISAAGLPAFIHSANTNYYSFLYDAWFAQYNGTDGVNDYFDGIYENFMGERVVGYDVTHNQGILEAIKVMDSIFGGGYSHPKSNAIDWEVTQTYFMIGEAAMFANGDWHHQEMMKQFPDSDIRFLRVPVVSALGTKLGITDEQLAQFIDYADGKRGLPEVSTEKHTAQELAEIICDARSHVASYADFFMTYIPVYADNVDLAKTFLKFMVSDQGQHIFCEATKGLTQCYGYDLESDALYDNLSTFAKTRWDIAKDANLYILNRGNAYARVGLQPFTVKSKAPIEALLSRTDDRWTVEEIYEYDYETYKAKWSILEDGANSIDVN